MSQIQLKNIRKSYGKLIASNDISLTIHDHEFMVLLGPSGCGKTTLLRAIAGLDEIDSGHVLIGQREVTRLPPRKRNISMVFQSYAVFPHMTVYDNIAFGLKMKHTPADATHRKVQSAAELLHIENLLERFPAQTSGGQRQRIAVARAIATEADVLLMDEPLSNLDALLRLEMRAELKKLLRDLKATVVYVTHDQIEALSLGDRIAVMKSGEILQCDSPLAVYDKPADAFVASFIGNPPMNMLKASTVAAAAPMLVKTSSAVTCGIRAENIDVFNESAPGSLAARVLVVEPLGSMNLVTARVGDDLIKVSLKPDQHPAADQLLHLRLPAGKIVWFDANGKAI